MKKIIFSMQIILGIICISLTSCKKEFITPTQSKIDMKQIFYTEEGTAYVLKVATKNTNGVIISLPTQAIENRVFVNVPDTITTHPPSQPEVKTNKKIIPLFYSLGWVDASTGAIQIDIATPYYSGIIGLTDRLTEAQKSQSKMWPLVDELFSTNNKIYNFNLRYGQVVLNDGDFIDPTTSLILLFGPIRGQALAGASFASQPVVVSGTYNVSASFIYFEML